MELQESQDLLETAVNLLLREGYLQTHENYADGSRSVGLTKAGYDSLYYLNYLRNQYS